MTMRPRTTEQNPRRRARAPPRNSTLATVVFLLVAVATGVVLVTVVQSASGRFAGTTSNRGSFLQAGDVRLELVADADDPEVERAELALHGDNLLPGDTVDRCIVLGYTGSIDDAEVRASARGGATAGIGSLAPFLLTELQIGNGIDPDCADFRGDVGSPPWTGTLAQFAEIHHDFASGLTVLEEASDGATATLHISVTLADDNRAQGLDSTFWLVFEVRP